jgi:hypothetical protein
MNKALNKHLRSRGIIAKKIFSKTHNFNDSFKKRNSKPTILWIKNFLIFTKMSGNDEQIEK